MKKLLLTLALSLSFAASAFTSHASQVVYYDNYDMDVACGLKSIDKESSNPKLISENEVKNGKKANTSKNNTANFVKAQIVHVSDGDTVTARIGNNKYKIRMIGVDTPETVHPSKPVGFYGKEASNFTKSQLSGREVYLEKDVSDTDRYYRSLRYIWLELPKNLANPTFEEVRDKMYNGILLRDGYGALATFPPNVKYLDYFRKLAQTAAREERGLYNKAEREKFEAYGPSESKETSKPSQGQSNSQGSSSPQAKGKFVGDGDIPIVNQKIGLASSKNGDYYADLTYGPIKANMNSGKYHRPGQQGYNKIKIDNVTWFSSPEAAEKAGYKPAQR